MKKNILLASFTALFLLETACVDDSKEQFLDEYNTILYFRDSGELPAEFYSTGEEGTYKLVVNKAGSDIRAVASVDAGIMSEAELAAYNEVQGTEYKVLPGEYYNCDASHLDFSSSESFKSINITLQVTKIGELQRNSESGFVIPLQLRNGSDSINSKKQYAFVIPEVLVPTVGFETGGYVNNTLSEDGEASSRISTLLKLPVPDKWGIQCELEVDETALDEYNRKNGTSYASLPEEYYELNKTITFKNDETTAPVEVLVKKAGMDYGNYVLPLRIKSISKKEFNPDEEKRTILLGISFTPPRISLTADMLSSNALEPSEGSLDNLLDGDVSTYFHSAWSVTVEEEHYVQVALNEPIRNFVFNYTTRNSNGKAAPAEFYVSISSDGNNFVELERFTAAKNGLPTNGAATWESPTVRSDTDIKYIRFTNVENVSGSKYFVWSEFSLAGK